MWCRSVVGLLSVFALSALLSGCSPQPVKRLSSQDNILAFGDSLTYGVGAKAGADYPSQLAELIGIEVNNYGISGETSAQGLTRFERVIAEVQPELVILLEGGNDILRNQKSHQTKHNLASMITVAQKANIQVVLIGVPSKSLFLSDADFYEELANEYDLIYIEGVISKLLKQPKYKSDAIHLNSAGYRILAERIEEALVDAGIISH